mgnify:CR=1 FL=1
MKSLVKTALLLATPLALLSCKSESSDAEAAAPPESGATPYPLETCVVSGKKLGSMGDPYVIVHEGQEIKFCCDACEPTFKEDPDKYLTQLKKD